MAFGGERVIVGSLTVTNEPFADSDVGGGGSCVHWKAGGMWELCILSILL